MEAETVATTPQVRPALMAEVVVVAVVVEQVFLVVLVDRELLLSVMRCQVCPRQF
jgi:F0F1-type ATP synthase membrane subunit c/vacuolar-type H+-ATPase subunit K